jgi:hypothetical protein
MSECLLQMCLGPDLMDVLRSRLCFLFAAVGFERLVPLRAKGIRHHPVLDGSPGRRQASCDRAPLR